MKAHKNQFDKLIHEARERMKKTRNPKKKSTNPEDHASTSAATEPHDGDDENSRDSVTIMEVKTSNDASVSGTDSVNKQPVVVIEDIATGSGGSEKLANLETKQNVEDQTDNQPDVSEDEAGGSGHVKGPATLETPQEADDSTENNKNSARVSLSFTTEDSTAETDKKVEEKSSKRRSISDLVSTSVLPADDVSGKTDQGINSTEPIGMYEQCC